MSNSQLKRTKVHLQSFLVGVSDFLPDRDSLFAVSEAGGQWGDEA